MKKNKGLALLLAVILCTLVACAFSACAKAETPPASEEAAGALSGELLLAATEENVEQKTEEKPLQTSQGPQMYCEKGLENGRPDMTHLFYSVRYESRTDEASALRYHHLYRICFDCGASVDFGATRCKTNSPLCEAGCL